MESDYKKISKRAGIVAAGCLVILVFFKILGLGAGWCENFYSAILAIVMISLLMLFSLLVDRCTNSAPKAFAFVGRNTLEIYMMHPFVNIFVRIITKRWMSGCNEWMIIFVNTVTVLAICVVLCILLPGKWCITRVLFGRISLTKRNAT